MKVLLLGLIFGCASVTLAQEYTSSSIFAHNDYATALPFYQAIEHEVGFIEADIFLSGNDLIVAHTRLEIRKERTLDSLYLKPLAKEIARNNGSVYKNSQKMLTLMIDIKSEAVATLHVLVDKLKQYPALTACSTLQLAVSGNVPEPSRWPGFPDFIRFDGRPNTAYTIDQLGRISFISTSFKNYSVWNGNRALPADDSLEISRVVDDVHKLGKKIRFWASPDSPNAWRTLMRLKVDIINTDDVISLAAYIQKTRKDGSKKDQPK